MRRTLFLILALALLMPQALAAAEAIEPDEMVGVDEAIGIDEDAQQALSILDVGDDSKPYRLVDEQGEYLTSRGGQIFVDDEYISSDDELYRVISVDDGQCVATARHIGREPESSVGEAQAVMAMLAGTATAAPDGTAAPKTADDANPSDNKLICMYSTHSDESYEKGDGTFSKTKNAGIYDVGDALKSNLEQLGIKVEYSKDTFLPHDAGAYRRSRSQTEEYVKQRPAAILDLHRDGIPDPSEYTTTVDGEKMTKVRLFVGRNNPNASANRAFAKQMKKTADEQYPGLIKDIFIGKGNYNQELYPKALLLEFGTHTSNKDQVEKSTKNMAQVISDTLFGGAAKAEDYGNETRKSSASGIGWLIGIAILGAAIYGLVATGTLRNWQTKLARGSSELTGGLIGKKSDEHDDK